MSPMHRKYCSYHHESIYGRQRSCLNGRSRLSPFTYTVPPPVLANNYWRIPLLYLCHRRKSGWCLLSPACSTPANFTSWLRICTYTPLVSGKELRLLYLLPASRVSDDIKVEIFIADFQSNEVPHYEALSYVWGSTSDRRMIKVRGISRKQTQGFLSFARRSMSPRKKASTLAVTRNLETALRHLRQRKAVRILWVDAICIHQDDCTERSAEVGRMGAIFSAASQVVVWLGPESEDSALAVTTLQRIGQDVVYDYEKATIYARDGTETSLLEINDYPVIVKHAKWIAVKNLLKRDWFKRLWIIQEVKLAARAIIIIGYRKIAWPTFSTAFYWIWAMLSKYTKVFEGIDFVRTGFLVRPSKQIGTLELLSYTRSSLCSDPRDRIYAILSLLRSPLSQGIVPNYQLGPEEIYKYFALRYIRVTGALDILELCTIQGQCPSWLPNLAIPSLLGGPFLYCTASSQSRHELLDSVDGSLSIRGLHTSSIGSVGNTFPQWANAPEILAFCHRCEPKDIVTLPYKHGGTMLDAYLSTLIGGFTLEALPSNTGLAPTMEDCRSFFYNCIRGQQIEGLSSGQLEYLRHIREYLPGRTFFTTADGYVGLCPADAKCGDHICVILGCKSPLLLRPLTGHDTHYQLVGECYVHGLMRGEGLLGPIPILWQRKHLFVNDTEMEIWEHASGGRTREDPRLGPMPSNWKRFYRDSGGNYTDQPFGGDGTPHKPYFENIETGDITWADPRLTTEALRSKGVDIREFILV